MKEITGNRALLLKVFFTNPEKSYYMQEIGRMIGKPPGVFQRVINNLEEERILSSEYKANARYFKVNKDYPLYEEFKRIIFKTVGIAGSIKKILEEIGDIQVSFIYGSYAKNQENPVSDVDVVIVGQPEEDAIIREFDKLEKALSREINYKLYSKKQFNNAIVENDPFLINIIRNSKIMIMGEEDELRRLVKKQSN